MPHRLVYGVVWKRVTEWQECWLDEAQQGGRRQGEHIADAWDLQAQIEEANLEGKPIVGALLDHEQFFDKFHPDLVRGLLRASGFLVAIANQMHYLYGTPKRYVKVAGTFGAAIAQTNGVGQGCSLSITVANLYVGTLFRAIRSKRPSVDLGAFLDDRSFIAGNIEKLTRGLGGNRRVR